MLVCWFFFHRLKWWPFHVHQYARTFRTFSKYKRFPTHFGVSYAINISIHMSWFWGFTQSNWIMFAYYKRWYTHISFLFFFQQTNWWLKIVYRCKLNHVLCSDTCFDENVAWVFLFWKLKCLHLTFILYSMIEIDYIFRFSVN